MLVDQLYIRGGYKNRLSIINKSLLVPLNMQVGKPVTEELKDVTLHADE